MRGHWPRTPYPPSSTPKKDPFAGFGSSLDQRPGGKSVSPFNLLPHTPAPSPPTAQPNLPPAAAAGSLREIQCAGVVDIATLRSEYKPRCQIALRVIEIASLAISRVCSAPIAASKVAPFVAFSSTRVVICPNGASHVLFHGNSGLNRLATNV